MHPKDHYGASPGRTLVGDFLADCVMTSAELLGEWDANFSNAALHKDGQPIDKPGIFTPLQVSLLVRVLEGRLHPDVLAVLLPDSGDPRSIRPLQIERARSLTNRVDYLLAGIRSEFRARQEEVNLGRALPGATIAGRLRAILDEENIDIPLEDIDHVSSCGTCIYGARRRGGHYEVDNHSNRSEIARLFPLYRQEVLRERVIEDALRERRRTKETADTAAETPKTDPPKTDKSSLADSAKTFAGAVAYRTAALQLTKRMRGLLADALVQHLKGKQRAAKRKMLLDLLDGPMGGPLVALLLSGLMPQVAGLIGQNGEKVGRLSEELRLHAGVTVASELVDGLFGLLGPAKEALTQAFSGLPEVPSLNEAGGGRGTVIDMETERVKAGAPR